MALMLGSKLLSFDTSVIGCCLIGPRLGFTGIWLLQPSLPPHRRLVAPFRALCAPLLRDLFNRDLGWVMPLRAELADGHERAEQQIAHERAFCRLQVVHESEAALADGRVDGVRQNYCKQQQDVVEGLVVELVGVGAVGQVNELVALLVEESVVQLHVREGGKGVDARNKELHPPPLLTCAGYVVLSLENLYFDLDC